MRLVRVAARATAASVTSSPASGTTYGAGETVTVRLAMDEAVLVTGRPHVWLDVGAGRRQAVYSGPVGTATSVLDFSYVVRSGTSTRTAWGCARRGLRAAGVST